MNLPDDVVHDLITNLDGVGRIHGATTLGGGCIHPAARIETDGPTLFCKWHRGDAATAFGAEARGLEALTRAAGDGGLRIPRVWGWREAAAGGTGWLVLEFLPPSPPVAYYAERLGRGLAHMHAEAAGGWGWDEANRIGALVQANPHRSSWAAFWREARLEPQIRLARDGGRLEGGALGVLTAATEATHDLLTPVENDGPSIVHGDLWAGNVHPGPDGRPVLVDPAVYRGHREVDLAMADLFGGLDRRARAAYEEAFPLMPGYARRRPLYQLYYLLVHLNLFGAGYLEASLDAARRVTSGAD